MTLSTLTVAVSGESNRLIILYYKKLQSLQVQGECFRLVDTFDVWSVAVSSVTEFIMKLSFNTLDTLPLRHNLLKWVNHRHPVLSTLGSKRSSMF